MIAVYGVTPLRITAADGAAIEVEILDGPAKGRRGWISEDKLTERRP